MHTDRYSTCTAHKTRVWPSFSSEASNNKNNNNKATKHSHIPRIHTYIHKHTHKSSHEWTSFFMVHTYFHPYITKQIIFILSISKKKIKFVFYSALRILINDFVASAHQSNQRNANFLSRARTYFCCSKSFNATATFATGYLRKIISTKFSHFYVAQITKFSLPFCK